MKYLKNDMNISDKTQIGKEILSYLIDHPEAQDTIEGIVEWWLLERKIKFQTTQVKEALSELVAKGLVFVQNAMNSKTHYQINPNKHKEIQDMLKKRSE